MQIAIDGPAGVGKSTVAQEVARRLGIIYLDTGAMYRAVTLACLQAGLQPEEEGAIAQLLEDIRISFFDHGQGVLLQGQDVSSEIRTLEVSNIVSAYAALPIVRQALTRQQQAIAEKESVVMDGRDIGTVVLPEADYKFFLEASPEVRARRRAKQLRDQGKEADDQALALQIAERDCKDRNRAHAPLKKASDAQEIQTDDLSIEEVISKILQSID